MTMNSISGNLKVKRINKTHGIVDTLTEVLDRIAEVMSNYRTSKKYPIASSKEYTLDIVRNKLKFSRSLLKSIIDKNGNSIGIDRGNIMMAIHNSYFYTSSYYTIIVESANDDIRIEEKDLAITISFLINIEGEVYDVDIITLR